jgi:hypothetical protein
MAKDPMKNTSRLSPARIEDREWQHRAEEQKKTKKAKAKPKREDVNQAAFRVVRESTEGS